jgi:hypothetical protein
MTSPVDPDDFDIAKAIAAHIKDLPKERRERVFRWVAESLGLSSPLSRPTAIAPTLAMPSDAMSTAPPLGGKRDIKSFVTAKAPKGDAQFATAVGYYYRFEAPPDQQRQSINSEMLQESTRLVGRPRFSNPLNTLNNAKKAGYLDNISRGEFSINSVGENLVAMTLPGSDPNSNGGRRTKRAPKSARTRKKR